MRISLVYIILILNVVFLKNLTLHDYDNPSANHILDTEIPHDNSNLLILVGMLGWIEFYDISIPENLVHLDNLTLSSGGGGGRCWCGNSLDQYRKYGYCPRCEGYYCKSCLVKENYF